MKVPLIVTAMLLGSGVATAEPVRDPTLTALANKALTCTFVDGEFDRECPAYKAFIDYELLSNNARLDDTIMAMLGDPDPRQRVLAEAKGFDSAERYFATKTHAVALLDVVKRTPAAGHSAGTWVSYIDADKHGLGDAMLALTKHPSVEFRRGLSAVISRYQTRTPVQVVEALIADPKRVVQLYAISALGDHNTAPTEPVCKLLAKHIARADELTVTALMAASTSECPLRAVVIDELARRTKDPKQQIKAVGLDHLAAINGVCRTSKSRKLAKQGFEIAKRLADPSVPDPITRGAALESMIACDVDLAGPLLKRYAKDKSPLVAERARDELGQLERYRREAAETKRTDP